MVRFAEKYSVRGQLVTNLRMPIIPEEYIPQLRLSAPIRYSEAGAGHTGESMGPSSAHRRLPVQGPKEPLPQFVASKTRWPTVSSIAVVLTAQAIATRYRHL